MPRLRILAAKLKSLFSGRNENFDDEINEHIELLTRRLLEQGATPEEAAWSARRQFGHTTLLRENTAEMQRFLWLHTWWRDTRFAIRQLRASPTFTTMVVITLALGIGANTAVFTLLDQLVLRLLPVKQPEQLVMIWPTGPAIGGIEGDRSVSYPMYQDFQRSAPAFESVFCRYGMGMTVRSGDAAERVQGELVSGNYFQALGVQPALGRVFSPEADDRVYEGHPSAVLSYRYWLNRFAGDRNIIGKKILVNNYPLIIVGVAAPGFIGLDPAEPLALWVPIQMQPVITSNVGDMSNRRREWVQVFARLKPGWTLSSARSSLQQLLHRITLDEMQEPEILHASNYDRARFMRRSVSVERAANGFSGLREQYSTALVIVMGMAALILLIACFNVASLLIARAGARQKEIAVRLSLGAKRSTIILQLLIESGLLSFAGAVLGLLVSVVTARELLTILPIPPEMMTLQAAPDSRILLFCTAVAFATGILFGIAPALQSTSVSVWATLKEGAAAVAGTARSARLRKVLVTAQVTLSFLLLAGAGLFALTLKNLRDSQRGFKDIGALVTFQVDAANARYSVPRIHALYDELLSDFTRSPAVTAAAYAWLPVLHGTESDTYMNVEGHQAKDGEDMDVYYNAVSPGYWKAMGVPILEGRDFDSREPSQSGSVAAPPTAAIVNRRFAEHFFGQRSPIGRKISFGGRDKSAPPTIPIVGMVENSLNGRPRAGVQRQVFFAYNQVPVPTSAWFYLRSSIPRDALFGIVRRIVAKHDPSLPVTDMKTLSRQFDETLSSERLIASLSLAFAVLATLLAALGLYGVMTFVVARRTKEIGLRIALGAGQSAVLWMVLREAIALTAAGLLIGIPTAYALNRYLSSELFGVVPTNLPAWTAAIAILCVAAVVSTFLPAHRASSIDPTIALRYE